MESHPNDTIFALSSGALPAGIAVVRLSGPQAFGIAATMAGPISPSAKASLRTIRSRDGSVLDQGLVLGFQAPHSFTGEDCVELHLHGSRAVVATISAELASFAGVRMAEAGEFSRRAFDNGKLDLVEIEGLADLIAAETEMQRRLAIEQSFGNQSLRYMEWAERLTRARALIEAELDFADEEDVPGSVSDRVWADVAGLQTELIEHLAASRGGEIIRDGFKVVLMGPPNAGKSSLLNALARRDVAIVTDIAGTTRDILHVDLDMDGYLVRFFDTAGLRDSDDAIEREGIRRAKLAIEGADLVLSLHGIDSAPQRIDKLLSTKTINVGTKRDIYGTSPVFDVCISVVTGEGLDDLRGLILGQLRVCWSGSMVPNRQRHLQHLKLASNFIDEALSGSQLDLQAESLRAAASSLGRITGRVDVEQLLGLIFSQFCIGK